MQQGRIYSIKNIIFDIGSVILRWEPYEVIKEVFPDKNPKDFYLRTIPLWIERQSNKLNEEEAICLYARNLNVSKNKISELFLKYRTHQTETPGIVELLRQLHKMNFQLYSITDNVRESVDYYRSNLEFVSYLKDIIISGDLGISKADSRIYSHLLNKHALQASESIFIDDLKINVEIAKSLGMKGIVFSNIQSCINELKEHKIKLRDCNKNYI